MNIKSLFEKQYENNKKIIIDPSLNEYKLSARKNLDLNIKLAALADATECYKYWIDTNLNETINENIIFQKYIELFSQIITLGLDRNYDDSYEVEVVESEYCLSDQFLTLFIDINDLTISPSEDHYQTLLQDYISLGISLGLSEKKIIDMFLIN